MSRSLACALFVLLSMIAVRGSAQPRPQSAKMDTAAARYSNSIRAQADSSFEMAMKFNLLDVSKHMMEVAGPRAQADSAMHLLIGARVDLEALVRSVRRRRDDFDAKSPPLPLSRIHQQMLAALDTVATSIEAFGRIVDRCTTARDLGPCGFPGIEGSMKVIEKGQAYCDARDRARRTLMESAVILDSLRRCPLLKG